MAAPSIPFVTVEEYLEFERNAEQKHEYYRGRILAMAGGSPNHSLISASLAALLWNATRGTTCQVFNSDLRLAVDQASHYNATLICEVSPSTERADRGRKFTDYQHISSLREYLLVSQFDPCVELFRRQPDGKWSYEKIEGLHASVRLESIGAELKLLEIYEKVEFEPEAG